MKPKISDLAQGYTPPHKVLKWAGREVTVYKMSPRSLERAIRVAEPHIRDVIAEIVGMPLFAQARAGEKINLDAAETEMGRLIKERISEMILAVPAVVLQILACIMDIPEEGPEADFFWNEVSLDELLGSIEQLDELNDFRLVGNRLIQIVRYLAGRYGLKIADMEIEEKQLKEQEVPTEEN